MSELSSEADHRVLRRAIGLDSRQRCGQPAPALIFTIRPRLARSFRGGCISGAKAAPVLTAKIRPSRDPVSPRWAASRAGDAAGIVDQHHRTAGRPFDIRDPCCRCGTVRQVSTSVLTPPCVSVSSAPTSRSQHACPGLMTARARRRLPRPSFRQRIYRDSCGAGRQHRRAPGPGRAATSHHPPAHGLWDRAAGLGRRAADTTRSSR